jgi:hypothetical protein
MSHLLSQPEGQVTEESEDRNEQNTDDKPREPTVNAANKGHEERGSYVSEGLYHGAQADDGGDNEEEM